MEFIFNPKISEGFAAQDMLLILAINPGAEARLYIDETKVIDVKNSKYGKTITCKKDERLETDDPLTKRRVSTGCCRPDKLKNK